MELTASDLWSHILDSARTRVPEQSYRTWLSGTQARSLSERELVVEAPSEFHVHWLGDKYRPLLSEIAERILGRPIQLTFNVSADAPPPVPQVSLSPLYLGGEAPDQTGDPSPLPSGQGARRVSAGLNERYTFERFVVGNNNQLAAAACHAVAENPARTYNPLFLYGGVGLGKTHLMQAIGNRLLSRDQNRRIVYLSTEQFTNELVTSIQGGTTSAFRRRYRVMDLLLVDDVHFLEGKERTQEEFFHTFNALYDAHRQIVLTSDRPPKEIGGLEDRLVSRFEWGLVADMKAPDFETRVAILRKKAEDDRLILDDEVIDFIAHSCTASVRELEGAVIKLLAYSSLTNQEITVALARTALTAMLGSGKVSLHRDNVTPDHIRAVVAQRWGVRPDALSSKRRTKDVILPRQVAMYLIKDILGISLVRVGGFFGGRDHSTVIHSIRKVEDLIERDADFRQQVEAARADVVGPR